jgi:hypothetical protein
MKGFSVFYSWQSDLPRRTTRDFIHQAAEIAIKRVVQCSTLVDSPRLDHDTAGVSGTPSIGDTILGKIDKCGVFLADVSLVGETSCNDKPKKRTPNPNVLLELGYAMGKVGWKRVILVMNSAFGDADELPFDLRYRRFPIQFHLTEEKTELRRRENELAGRIEMAIRVAAQEEHQAVTDILRRVDGFLRQFMRDNADKNAFWETELRGGIPNQIDLAIYRLLELGIIECFEIENKSGYAYTWTHLGRLCFSRLRLANPPTLDVTSQDANHTPHVSVQTNFLANEKSPSVITCMAQLDELLQESDNPEPIQKAVPKPSTTNA